MATDDESGWCTPPGQSLQPYTAGECANVSGCTDWASAPDIIGQVGEALGQLINPDPGPDVGICTIPFTNPPMDIRLTKAQCDTIRGGVWRPQ